MEIWNPLIELSKKIELLFDDNFIKDNELELFQNWKDSTWHSDHVRKCHLKIIDNRKTQKLWLMHINIFPHTHFNFPILGFDIVAGQNKITGSFFDFSPVLKDYPQHTYMNYMEEYVKDLSWSKPRELPEWAQQIFSNNMIAAGNLKTEKEINQLCEVCYSLIEYYVTHMHSTAQTVNSELVEKDQNFYCSQQKLNPHLHRSITSMGISKEDKDRYINEILFQEI